MKVDVIIRLFCTAVVKKVKGTFLWETRLRAAGHHLL